MPGNDDTKELQVEAAKGVVQLVDRAYDDLLSGVARETGKALTLVGRAVNVTLAPLRGLIWTAEEACSWIESKVAERLDAKGVTEPQTPPPSLYLPVVQGVAVAGTEDLRGMYANLLATAMDPATAHLAHPGFVEVLRQICTDEARLLPFLYQVEGTGVVTVTLSNRSVFGRQGLRPLIVAGFREGLLERQDLEGMYLVNLARLGILDLAPGAISAEDGWLRLEEVASERIKRWTGKAQYEDFNVKMEHGRVRLTAFGSAFCEACLPSLPESYFPR